MTFSQIISFLMLGIRALLLETLGFSFIGVAILLSISLVTYHPSDVSLNVAVDGVVQNLMGSYGAYIADILMQLIGLASYGWAFFLAALGFHILSSHKIQALIQRVGLLLLASFFVAFGLETTITLSSYWHTGGAVGALLREGYYTLLPVQAHLFAPALGIVSLLIGVFLLTLAYRLPIQSLLLPMYQAGQHASSMISKGIVLGPRLIQKVAPLVQRSTNLWPKRERSYPYTNEPSMQDSMQEPTFTPFTPSPVYAPSLDDLPTDSLSLPGETAKSAFKENFVQAIWAVKTPQQPKEHNTPEFVAYEEGQLPPLDLLSETPINPAGVSMPQHVVDENVALLARVLDDFGIRGEIIDVKPGPVVTMYELRPAPGVKSSRVIGLADDIARSMSALSARVAVVPGRNVIGIELPNPTRETVYLRDLFHSKEYTTSNASLALALGEDINGSPVIADLARMPHLLVAGTTGSGKSVAVNGMILSLLFKLSPEKCKFIMIDPKMLELSIYDGIPHLLAPVVTDPKKAVVALKWTVREMESRYRAMSQLNVRNIDGYNTRLREARQKGELIMRKVQVGFDSDTGKPVFESQPLNLDPLPFIVVVVDEMADLMLVAGKDIEAAVQRLAQMARAAGIHLIMATQRPSVDVITGTIKANFPTRISFQVTSKIDSRTILGEQGAEQLLGQGDMLYMAAGGRISRVHGPFVTDKDVEIVVQFLKAQGSPQYIEDITQEDDEGSSEEKTSDKSGDTLYDQAVEIVCREGKASTSYVQRQLQIGYNRAARIIERMEDEGIVSEANHTGKREVLKRI